MVELTLILFAATARLEQIVTNGRGDLQWPVPSVRDDLSDPAPRHRADNPKVGVAPDSLGEWGGVVQAQLYGVIVTPPPFTVPDAL